MHPAYPQYPQATQAQAQQHYQPQQQQPHHQPQGQFQPQHHPSGPSFPSQFPPQPQSHSHSQPQQQQHQPPQPQYSSLPPSFPPAPAASRDMPPPRQPAPAFPSHPQQPQAFPSYNQPPQPQPQQPLYQPAAAPQQPQRSQPMMPMRPQPQQSSTAAAPAYHSNPPTMPQQYQQPQTQLHPQPPQPQQRMSQPQPQQFQPQPHQTQQSFQSPQPQPQSHPTHPHPHQPQVHQPQPGHYQGSSQPQPFGQPQPSPSHFPQSQQQKPQQQPAYQTAPVAAPIPVQQQAPPAPLTVSQMPQFPRPTGPFPLKQISRSSRISWCPNSAHPNLFVSGSVAGSIDGNFDTSSQLEIFDLNLQSDSNDFKLCGSVRTTDAFQSIAWGTKAVEDSAGSSFGILAGGMSDGSLNLWDASTIVREYRGESLDGSVALLARSDSHKGPVTSLQFHPQQPNLLASGSSDGEIFVWDLANIRDPKSQRPNPALKSNNSGVTAVAWNHKVPKIVASCNEAGETVVWDLRQKRSVLTFKNSNRIPGRASAVSWNPDTSVQLAVSYSNSPVVEIWDLRQSLAPRSKLEGFHSGGILAIDWCVHDTELLLSSGEDARVAGWNPSKGEFLTEFANDAVSYDVRFAQNHRGLFSTSSFDGNLSIRSIPHTGTQIPKWFDRTAGAAFGFAGKLVSFKSSQQKNAEGIVVSDDSKGKLTIQQVMTEPEVISMSQQFQSVFESRDFRGFCAHKISSAASEDEMLTWTFIRILFEDPQQQRYLLLKELGFEAPDHIAKEVAERASEQKQQHELTAANAAGFDQRNSLNRTSNFDEIDPDKFFDQDFPDEINDSAAEIAAIAPSESKSNLLSPNGKSKPSESHCVNRKEYGEDEIYRTLAASDDDEAAIRQALIFGDFRTAVDRCLKTNRIADALIFSTFGDAKLWEEVREHYFSQHRHPFIKKVMKMVAGRSLDSLVSDSELDNWKETLAVLITYTNNEQYRNLVTALGQRLQANQQLSAAIVCYLCSSNIEKSIQLWNSKKTNSPAIDLHNSIEKISIFAQAIQASQNGAVSPSVNEKYAEYASMLASQGFLIGAWNYMKMSNSANDAQSAALLDRIYHASHATLDQAIQQQPPQFPFHAENVQPDPAMNQIMRHYDGIRSNYKQKLAQIQLHSTNQQQPQQQPQQQQQQQHQQNQQQMQPIQSQPIQPQQPIGFAQPQQRLSQPQAGFPQQNGIPQQPMQSPAAAPAGRSMPQPQAQPLPQQFAGHQTQPSPSHQPIQPQQRPQPTMNQPQPMMQPPTQQPQPQQQRPAFPQPQAQVAAPQPAPVQQFNPQQPQFGANQQQPQQFQPKPFQPQPTLNQPIQQQFHQPQAQPQPQLQQPAPVQSQPQHFQPQSQSRPAPMPQSFQPQAPVQPQQQPAQPNSFAPQPQFNAQPQPSVHHPSSAQVHPNPAAAAAQPALFNPIPQANTQFQPQQQFQPAQQQQPQRNPMQQQSQPQSAAAMAGPVDQKQLMGALENCVNALFAKQLPGPDAKKVQDIQTRLQILYGKLASNELSSSAIAELGALSTALANSDYTTATKCHLNLVKTDWASNNEWLLGLKTLLTMGKKFLGGI